MCASSATSERRSPLVRRPFAANPKAPGSRLSRTARRNSPATCPSIPRYWHASPGDELPLIAEELTGAEFSGQRNADNAGRPHGGITGALHRLAVVQTGPAVPRAHRYHRDAFVRKLFGVQHGQHVHGALGRLIGGCSHIAV